MLVSTEHSAVSHDSNMVDSTHQQPQGPVSLTKDSAPDDSDPQCDICHEPFLTGENQEIPIALPVSTCISRSRRVSC